MLCPNCGAEIRDGLSFCPKCGADIDGAPDRVELIEENKIVNAEPVNIDGSISLGNNNYYTPPQQEPPKKKHFYEKTWFIILMLIFVWPLGVFLMWRFSRWHIAVKIVISAIFAVGLIGTIAGNDNTDTTGTNNEPTTTEEADAVEPRIITADDILSVSTGDDIQIKCYSGSFRAGQHHTAYHDGDAQCADVYLLAKDSNEVEWDIYAEEVYGATEKVQAELERLVKNAVEDEEAPGYDVTIRGIVIYAGEGAEGLYHPHGIHFSPGKAEIIKIEKNKD